MTATSVKHLDPTQVELEISISPEELDAARERAFRQLVRNVKIPGFRPGKAPRKVFEAAYGSEIIHERAVENVLPEAYTKAVRENDLSPVDQPQVELLPQEEGEPLRLRATVTVRPQIELKEYKGIAVTVPPTDVPPGEVDRTLENLRREAATLVPVDRPVEIGDTATLDYLGSIDGVPFEGGQATNQPTEMVEERFIPGFVSGIVGMKAGEQRNVEAHFPEDYSNKDLAGKTAVFDVTVHDVKLAELPELDDEFAKRFNPQGNLEGLKADIARRLGENIKELPPVMVERETEGLTNEAKSYVERAGLEWSEYLAKQEKTEAEIAEGYRAEAERRVKSTLLLEAIARAEKIEASDADIENEIATMARQYGQPRAAIIEMLRPNMGGLIDGIVRSKTLDFLVDNAVITEAAPAPSETNPAPAQSSE